MSTPSTKKGFIYILTNPSFPDYVKIGYADHVEARVRQLNRSECTPFAFRVYATYEVAERLADRALHRMIDALNPGLRSSELCKGRLRVREFYAMRPEEAYAILEAMAQMHGCPERLHLVQASEEELRDEEQALRVTEGRRLRRARFSFSLCGIEPGEVVEFWYTYRKPSGIWCPVLDGEHVEYEGRAWSLSGLARRLTGAERGVPGPSYFKYRGEWLNDLRDRLGR